MSRFGSPCLSRGVLAVLDLCLQALSVGFGLGEVFLFAWLVRVCVGWLRLFTPCFFLCRCLLSFAPYDASYDVPYVLRLLCPVSNVACPALPTCVVCQVFE